MATKSDKKQRSQFFRVAVEGATTDGRVIERQQILDMAETYSPAVYGARIWMEHYRSLLPDSPFRAYGDVLATKAEEVEIDGEKKLALFAQVDPTSDLINMVNVLKQKVYTSIEIAPDFAGKGKAYLYGLAVTDSPASIGTSMLAFSAKHPDESPLKDRKQAPENLFSEAAETSITFESAEPVDVPRSPLGIVLSGLLGRGKQAKPTPEPVKDDAEFDVAAFSSGLSDAVAEQDAAMAKLSEQNRNLTEQVQRLGAQFSALRKQMDETPQVFTQRPVIAGVKGGKATDATDC